jgi:hypothetical protein
MYKIAKIPFCSDVVVRISDNAAIPFDPANTDYQAYLAWLAEGNVPTPADQPTE